MIPLSQNTYGKKLKCVSKQGNADRALISAFISNNNLYI